MFALLIATELSSPSLGGTTGPDLTRYFVACGLILGTTAVLAYGFRRLIADTLQKKAARRSMRIVDVLPLGGKRRLTVVHCYDRTFLLGLGDKDVSLVAELDRVIGEEQPGAALENVDRRDFARLVKQAVQAPPLATEPAAEPAPEPARARPASSLRPEQSAPTGSGFERLVR